MTGVGDSSVRGPDRRISPHPIVRLVLPAVVVMLFYVAWELVPPYLSVLWGLIPRGFWQGAVIGFLDGLLIAYGGLLLVAVVGLPITACILAGSRKRPGHRRWLSRVVLLDFSLLISLIGLEVASAAWLGWLHRSPVPPRVRPEPAVVAANLPGGLVTEKANPAARPLRIVVIGESSARGDPYNPWLSVGDIVAWQLERIFPGRAIQVDMRAKGGFTLEAAHQTLSGVTYRPDVLILFSGHNEFQARWIWSRSTAYYIDERDHQRKISPVELALRTSPWCRLVLETLDVRSTSSLPPKVITRNIVDHPTCTESERAALVTDFRRRIEAITAYCESQGTVPVFIVPASNDGDYEPNRSVLPATADSEVRESFTREFQCARDLEKDDPSHALAAYRRLLTLAPGFAESHYRLAQLLERAGSWDEAREHYFRARECDALPLRCPEDFREIYRAAAARHPSIVLVDSAAVLGPLSPHGILDDHLYHDPQHPTLLGYIALAQAVLNGLHDRLSLGWPAGVPAPIIEPDECARHFQLDKGRWVNVCNFLAWFWGAMAYIRHDPTERLKREESYRDAIRLIESGKPVEQARITGLGVHPAIAP
jgi:tetratricopeptide (TPR) repeat protein